MKRYLTPLFLGTALTAMAQADLDLCFETTPYQQWPVVAARAADQGRYLTYVYRPQEVVGWTLNPASFTTGCAATVSFVGWGGGSLGAPGYTAPATAPLQYYDSEWEQAHVLGMVASAGRTVQYTRPITLPAGHYRLFFPLYNVWGTGVMEANLFGFVADGGEARMLRAASYPTGEWVMESVALHLDEETTGVLSVGYTSPLGAKIDDMPHLWIDRVEIRETTPDDLDEDQLDGISQPRAERADTPLYDLQGRRLRVAPAKGLYIKEGKVRL